MVPREDLLGLERANTELGGRGGGAGTAASNGAQGSVQPKGYRALDGKSSTNHGHKRGDAIREEGPGPGMDGASKGLSWGSAKTRSCLDRLMKVLKRVLNLGLMWLPSAPGICWEIGKPPLIVENKKSSSRVVPC